MDKGGVFILRNIKLRDLITNYQFFKFQEHINLIRL